MQLVRESAEVSLKRSNRRQKRVHPDFYMELWILIRSYRILLRTGVIKSVLKRGNPPIKKGKTPSIRQVCTELAARGGFMSAVGGNVEAVAKENALRRTQKWVLFENPRSAKTTASSRPIFLNHRLENADTLRARYQEANKIVSSDRRTWHFWRNICRQRLGHEFKPPAKPPKLRNFISH